MRELVHPNQLLQDKIMQDGIGKIVQRLGGEAEKSLITEIYRYLERSKGNSGETKDSFQSKEGEAKNLVSFIEKHKLRSG